MKTKTKITKKTEKPKRKEKPGKDKPKRTPAKPGALKQAWLAIETERVRNDVRTQALARARNILREMGYVFDAGDALIIISRLKTMLAFDLPELHESLQKSADATKFNLIHVPPNISKNKNNLTLFLKDVVDVTLANSPKPKTIKRSKNILGKRTSLLTA